MSGLEPKVTVKNVNFRSGAKVSNRPEAVIRRWPNFLGPRLGSEPVRVSNSVSTLLTLLLVASCSGPPGDESTQRILVLSGGTLNDGTGASPIRDAVVVIKDSLITSAGSRDDVEIPPNAELIDVTGKWLVPGMSDAHVHLHKSGGLYSGPADYDLRPWRSWELEVERFRTRLPYTLSRYLCSGVTSIVGLAETREGLLMRDQATTLLTSPSVFMAGPFMANIPFEFHEWTQDDPVGIQVKTPDDVRRLVGEQIARGVNLIKLGFINDPEFPLRDFLPILEAAIQESHQRGVRVVVHAEELESAKAAVRAGADVLAHTINDQVVDQEFIQMVKDAGVISISSLHVRIGNARVLLPNGPIDLLEAERTCGDPEAIDSWGELSGIPVNERPRVPESIRTYSTPAPRRLILENIKRMHDGGVQIAVGSDAGNMGTLHGAGYHQELALLAEAGIPPMDILVAATRNAAAVSGVDDRGTVQAGRLADLLILDADPLADIGNLAKIQAVVKGGVILDHASLVALSVESLGRQALIE